MKISGALFAVFLKFIGMGRYDCASCEFQAAGVDMTVLHVSSRLMGFI